MTQFNFEGHCPLCGQGVEKKQLGITPKQAHVLNIIKIYIEENGFSPRLEDIKDALGEGFGNSIANIVRYLKQLEKRGRIRRQYKQERSIVLI